MAGLNGYKRPTAQVNDLAAAKRRRTDTDHDSLFCSEDEDISEVADNGLAEDCTPDRLDGRSQSNATPIITAFDSQPRSRHSPAMVTKTHGTISSSQPKAATKIGNPRKKSTEAEIKDEPENSVLPSYFDSLDGINHVKIYIGKRQRQTFAKREEIAKSPILTSYIVDDAEQGAYIMRPQLLRTDPNDFEAVLQFIHTGTFEPLLTEKDGEKRFEKAFTNDEHGRDLVRLGKIYAIAQMFQVQGLEDAIYDKVCAIGARRFPNKAFVEVAGVIFSDKRIGIGSGASAGSQTGVTGAGEIREEDSTKKDQFEEWIIMKIATNLQEIQKHQHEDFWAVEKRTTKKMFYARVLESAAEIYRANSGKLPDPAFVEID